MVDISLITDKLPITDDAVAGGVENSRKIDITTYSWILPLTVSNYNLTRKATTESFIPNTQKIVQQLFRKDSHAINRTSICRSLYQTGEPWKYNSQTSTSRHLYFFSISFVFQVHHLSYTRGGTS